MNEEYEVKIIAVKIAPMFTTCIDCCFCGKRPSDSPSDPCKLCGDNIFVKRYELVRIK